ncbi:MAG TPA: Eco57I restriction-modification methylase domain-containing protein [Rhizomicrobium sp.]
MLGNTSAEVGASLAFARTMVREAVTAWWNARQNNLLKPWPIVDPPSHIQFVALPENEARQAQDFGLNHVDSPKASYTIGCYYTQLMPKSVQSHFGAFYTPPALCERLLDLVTEEGVDWRSARVLDPACGGGAFLSPVARRMVLSLSSLPPRTALKNILSRLCGYELDPFAGWLSRVFLEDTLGGLCRAAGARADQVVEICNSLEREPDTFDLIVGNPPYGRITLDMRLRERFRRSLYGHANLYGVFTDLALRLSGPGSVIGYVTPTSFLAGEYFKKLRGLLALEAPPASVDFVSERKGIFVGVLQETMLAVFRKGARRGVGRVHHIALSSNGRGSQIEAVSAISAGVFELPRDPAQPWLLPRRGNDNDLIRTTERMPHRLANYGYGVSTGPLVWNRHKTSLRATSATGRYPLIWAESVRSDGLFEFRARRKNHAPYFEPLPNERWVVVDSGCVLVQRTTAKEQSRRLIAAELPASFVRRHKGVVVENHLNMIRPTNGKVSLSQSALAALLNTEVLDRVLRCINGSVAVSAYELECLPLPSPREMQVIERLVAKGSAREAIERAACRAYGGKPD